MTATQALASIHYLYVGYFDTAYVSGIEFNDTNNALTLVDTHPIEGASSRWITADHQLRNLYIAGDGIYQSYAVGSNRSLTFRGTNISDTSSCTLSVSLVVQHVSPYTVFGVSFGTGCNGLAISVDSSGALVSQIANVTYDTSAGVHGLAISPDSRFIYSADDSGSRVWAHTYDGKISVNYSSVTEIQKLAGSGARHLAVHPNGRWLYVIYESENELALYSRDADTGKLTDINVTYSLLPDSVTDDSLYWSSDVAVSNSSSISPKYLIAFARGRSNDTNGWITGFALDEYTGAILERIFIEEASGSGGTSNAVIPSSFSEKHFAVTDEGANYIELWQIADNGSSASAMACLDLGSGPVNAVWLS